MSTEPRRTGRRILAAVLDFLLIFLGGGYVIGLMTGQTTANGFALTGVSAILLFVLVAAYFVVMNRYAGGTIFRHVLGVARRSN